MPIKGLNLVEKRFFFEVQLEEVFLKKTHQDNIDDDLFLEDILSLWFFLSPRPLIKTGAKLRARSLDIAKKLKKLHSFRVEKMQKLHSFRVENSNLFKNKSIDRSVGYYVETSESDDVKLHSKRVEKTVIKLYATAKRKLTSSEV